MTSRPVGGDRAEIDGPGQEGAAGAEVRRTAKRQDKNPQASNFKGLEILNAEIQRRIECGEPTTGVIAWLAKKVGISKMPVRKRHYPTKATHRALKG